MAITEHGVPKAEARLAEELRHAAIAVAARYDRGRGRVVIRLNTGLEVMFPPRDAEGLERATAADLHVPGVLQGLFGSKRWMPARRLAEDRARTDRSVAARVGRRRAGKTAKTAACG